MRLPNASTTINTFIGLEHVCPIDPTALNISTKGIPTKNTLTNVQNEKGRLKHFWIYSQQFVQPEQIPPQHLLKHEQHSLQHLPHSLQHLPQHEQLLLQQEAQPFKQ